MKRIADPFCRRLNYWIVQSYAWKEKNTRINLLYCATFARVWVQFSNFVIIYIKYMYIICIAIMFEFPSNDQCVLNVIIVIKAMGCRQSTVNLSVLSSVNFNSWNLPPISIIRWRPCFIYRSIAAILDFFFLYRDGRLETCFGVSGMRARLDVIYARGIHAANLLFFSHDIRVNYQMILENKNSEEH